MVIFGKVYWYTGKWKYELNFILHFPLFGMIHFFNIVTFFLEVEFVNLFKEALWICHAWTVPKLIRWPRTSSWLCGCFQAACLLCFFGFQSVFFFFSVIHQCLMITELLIEKGIKKNWNNEWCFLFCHCGSRMGNRMVSILFVQQEPIPCHDLGIFTIAGRWSEKIKASQKKWMNKWWVSVKNKDLVDIYSWCTVIGSLCRYHHLKGIKQ